MYHPSRGGVRGGRDQFNWDDIKGDNHRENYLGHSIKAPVGRWQKGKDLHWYTRERQSDEAAAKEEIKRVQEEEDQAMKEMLGLAPMKSKKPQGNRLDEKEVSDLLKRGKDGEDAAPSYAVGERVEGLGFAPAPGQTGVKRTIAVVYDKDSTVLTTEHSDKISNGNEEKREKVQDGLLTGEDLAVTRCQSKDSPGSEDKVGSRRKRKEERRKAKGLQREEVSSGSEDKVASHRKRREERQTAKELRREEGSTSSEDKVASRRKRKEERQTAKELRREEGSSGSEDKGASRRSRKDEKRDARELRREEDSSDSEEKRASSRKRQEERPKARVLPREEDSSGLEDKGAYRRSRKEDWQKAKELWREENSSSSEDKGAYCRSRKEERQMAKELRREENSSGSEDKGASRRSGKEERRDARELRRREDSSGSDDKGAYPRSRKEERQNAKELRREENSSSSEDKGVSRRTRKQERLNTKELWREDNSSGSDDKGAHRRSRQEERRNAEDLRREENSSGSEDKGASRRKRQEVMQMGKEQRIEDRHYREARTEGRGWKKIDEARSDSYHKERRGSQKKSRHDSDESEDSRVVGGRGVGVLKIESQKVLYKERGGDRSKARHDDEWEDSREISQKTSKHMSSSSTHRHEGIIQLRGDSTRGETRQRSNTDLHPIRNLSYKERNAGNSKVGYDSEGRSDEGRRIFRDMNVHSGRGSSYKERPTGSGKRRHDSEEREFRRDRALVGGSSNSKSWDRNPYLKAKNGHDRTDIRRRTAVRSNDVEEGSRPHTDRRAYD